MKHERGMDIDNNYLGDSKIEEYPIKLEKLTFIYLTGNTYIQTKDKQYQCSYCEHSFAKKKPSSKSPSNTLRG